MQDFVHQPYHDLIPGFDVQDVLNAIRDLTLKSSNVGFRA